MSELNDLRSEVARLRRAATRKISRIKQTHGAQVSGTEFDPRRSTSTQRQYTQKQLESYKERLADFLSRSNQFVPDAASKPIPRSEFQRYKALEDQYRNVAGSVYERVKDVALPSGETIAERLAAITPLHKTMHNPAVNRIFDPHSREAGDIASYKALQKLIKQLERDASPTTVRRKVKQARDQYEQMMKTINMPELFEATKTLTNDQFVALWNYTTFASGIALAYQAAQKMLSPKDQSWGHAQLRQQMNDAMEMIDWARRI